MSPQTYQRSLDTGVATKFRNTASFLDTGAEFGAKDILDSLQAEVFDDIRGIGGNLTTKIFTINQQSLKLLGILRDWDGEVD